MRKSSPPRTLICIPHRSAKGFPLAMLGLLVRGGAELS